MNNLHKLDNWHKTWPIRIKLRSKETLKITPKSYEVFYKNHIMSLDILTDISDNSNCILSSFGSNALTLELISKAEEENEIENIDRNQNLSLDSLLESLPLVYNPSTKQLQIVKLKSKTNESFGSPLTGHLKTNTKHNGSPSDKTNYRFIQDKKCESISKIESNTKNICINVAHDNQDNLRILENLQNVPNGGSGYSNKFDSKVSNDSFPSFTLNEPVLYESGSSFSSSSTERYDLAPAAVTSHIQLDGTVSRELAVSAKKKKGITEFLTRNLFPWRSKPESKISPSSSDRDGESISSDISSHLEPSSSWRIFSKGENISSDSSDQKILTHELPAGSAGLIMEERPGNLPAKTPFEQERHKHEYKNIISAAKKKEMKEAKERRRTQTLQLKQEKQLSDSVHTWNTVIIPKWSTMHNQKKCRDLWWSGLPSCVRGKVWKLAIGNELNITPDLYLELVQRSLDKLLSLESDVTGSTAVAKNQESTLKLIDLDVSRTFPHLCIFQNGGPFHDPLHNILGAYVCYRPDVGYVQGMSFLAATLLLNLEESDAFIFFANLVNRPPHMAFFSVDQRTMQAYYVTFEQILGENLPQLADHLKRLNVSPSMYFLDWVLTVFARSFPLDIAARMWDIYLRDGEEFLFRAAIGILKHFEKELLAEDCTAVAAQFLTRLPEDLSAEGFFKNVSSVPVVTSTKKTFKEVLQENLQRASESV